MKVVDISNWKYSCLCF